MNSRSTGALMYAKLLAGLMLLLAVSLFAAPASALDPGEKCKLEESFDECNQRLSQLAAPTPPENTASEVASKAAAEVADKATPSTNPGVVPSVLDFLPTVLGSIGFDSLKDTDGNLNFDQNLGSGDWRLRLGGTVFTDAEIFEGLREALPEDGRADRVADLDDQIGDFDKVDFRLILAKERSTGIHRWGRDAKNYKDILKPIVAGALQQAVVVNPSSVAEWWLSPEVQDAQRRLTVAARSDRTLDDEIKITEIKLGDLRGILGDGTVDRLETSLTARAGQAEQAIEKDLKGVTDKFAELVANQPQVYAEGLYKQRKALTGVDEWSLRFCYEIGVAGNVNDYLDWADRTNDPDCAGGNSAECFASWLEKFKKAGDNGNRIAVAIEYKETQDLVAPADVADFAVAADQTYSAMVTYGRYLDQFSFFRLAGKQPKDDRTRFDLSLKWDEVDPEDMSMSMMDGGDDFVARALASDTATVVERNSRFVATATFSQAMTDNTTLSISAVYANKPEFLGEVDEKWGANFGFKWKWDGKKDQ